MHGEHAGTWGLAEDCVEELRKLGLLIPDSRCGNFAVIAVTVVILARQEMEGASDRHSALFHVIDDSQHCDVAVVLTSLSVVVRRYDVQENELSVL